MPKIKGGSVGSVNKLRKNLKKGAGGGFFKRIPEDGSLTGRFMTEPDGWIEFFEHYDPVRKYYPCSDDCPGCDEGDNPSQRYLANFLDADEGKVIPLLMPKTLASSVLKKYDKFKTLLDRDYELSREGSGRDATYDAIPESPSRMNLSRYDLLDLWELVENQLPSDDDDEEEEEEETPRRRGGGPRPAKKSVGARKRRETIADEDDEDEDDEPPRRTRRAASPARKSVGAAKKKKVAPKRDLPKRRTLPRR